MAERRWEDSLLGLADTKVEQGVPLAPLTSFGIGGAAEWLVQPETSAAAAAVWQLAAATGIPLQVLGGGTNVLVADAGIDGIVVDLRRGFGFLHEHPSAQGGAVWDVGCATGTGRLVRRAVQQGLAGLEVLAGVPGSLGGALIMNAGGHEGEIASVVRRVQLVDAGALRWVSRAEVGFSYRRSRFPAGCILLRAELELAAGDAAVLAAQVKAAQKRRRTSQPLRFANAGSIFKNPPGDFAGRLIEAAGCKGWREGDAEVSELHANFIINRGSARATDVLALVRRVRRRVCEHSGVELQLEVRLLGSFSGLDRASGPREERA